MHFRLEFYCLFIAFFPVFTLSFLVIFRLLSTCSSLELSYAFKALLIYIRVYTFPCCSFILSSFSHLSALVCPSLGFFFFSSIFLASLLEFQTPPMPNHLSLLSACVFLFVRLSHESLHVQLAFSPFTTPSILSWQTPPYGHTCWLRSKPVGCGAGRGGGGVEQMGSGQLKTYQ